MRPLTWAGFASVLVAGCATTRTVPTAPRPATWQSAQETVKSVLTAIPRVDNVRVSDRGLIYTHRISNHYMERRGKPRRVKRTLRFAEVAHIAVERTTTAVGNQFWQLAVTRRDESRLLFPRQETAEAAQSLAAALARLCDFSPDPRLTEPDLPPVQLDQQVPPDVPDEQLDRELELALSSAQPGQQEPRRSSLLLTTRVKEDPEPAPEPIRVTLRVAAQYVLPEEIEAEGEFFFMQMTAEGPDDESKTLGATVAVDFSKRIRLELGFRTTELSGSATTTAVMPPFLFGGGGSVTLLQSRGKVEIQTAALELSWGFRPLEWLGVRVGLGLRYASIEARYQSLPPPGVFGFAPPLSVDAKLGAPMLGVTLEWLGGDSPFGATLTVRGGGAKVSDKKLVFVETHLEVTYLWEETLGVALGYRVESLELTEEGETFLPISGSDSVVKTLLHGPTLALVVSF